MLSISPVRVAFQMPQYLLISVNEIQFPACYVKLYTHWVSLVVG